MYNRKIKGLGKQNGNVTCMEIGLGCERTFQSGIGSKIKVFVTYEWILFDEIHRFMFPKRYKLIIENSNLQ